MNYMILDDKRKVLLAKKLWDESKSKTELKKRISDYMRVAYPNYTVIEVHKYYAICVKRR